MSPDSQEFCIVARSLKHDKSMLAWCTHHSLIGKYSLVAGAGVCVHIHWLQRKLLALQKQVCNDSILVYLRFKKYTWDP